MLDCHWLGCHGDSFDKQADKLLDTEERKYREAIDSAHIQYVE